MNKIDAIDVIVTRIRRERPDLDATPTEVVGRIFRLQDHFQKLINDALEELGLRPGSYRVLAALRRSGRPFQLTPSQLLRSLMVTSGGMSNLLDRIEREGYIERLPDLNDRRGVLVKLTDKGLVLVDQAMAVNASVEKHLLSGLRNEDQLELADLLRKLLLSHEPAGIKIAI